MIGNFVFLKKEFSLFIKWDVFRLADFATHRYGSDRPVPDTAIYAWQILGSSVYLNNPDGDRSVMLSRPQFYDEQDVSRLN